MLRASSATPRRWNSAATIAEVAWFKVAGVELLLDRVAQAIKRAERHHRSVAVVLVDLDDFKIVNDSLGHAAGDELLQAVAARLSTVAQADDTVARLGGQEFALLVEWSEHDPVFEMVALHIHEVLRRRVSVPGMGIVVRIGMRIRLEELTAPDAVEFLAAVAASRALHHPWIDAPNTAERFAAVIERNESPDHYTFLIRDQRDGVLGGVVNVTNMVRGAFQSAFTGYWGFVAAQGRGLMTDGLSAVIRHAFTELGLHRLEANIQPANTRSIALAERCGFRLEGFSPNYLRVDGAWRDHNRYAITTEDITNL